MALGEFDLITAFFSDLGLQRPDVLLGVGDDCALLRPPPDRDLALSCDTLVNGVHFFSDVDPRSLGHKALAVNLSDLAAMGATPAWVSLQLTLPEVDEIWLAAFARGFAELAQSAQIRLVGGDTTRGPLSIGIQVQGFVPRDGGVRRSGARAGDLLLVSGPLGDAALGLKLCQQHWQADQVSEAIVLRALEWPKPRLDCLPLLRCFATSCIDLSDGLVADAGHIARSSDVAVEILVDQIPKSVAMKRYLAETGDFNPLLAGGDDYELCLTVSEQNWEEARAMAEELGIVLYPIGRVMAGEGIKCRLPNGQSWRVASAGYEHFFR